MTSSLSYPRLFSALLLAFAPAACEPVLLEKATGDTTTAGTGGSTGSGGDATTASTSGSAGGGGDTTIASTSSSAGCGGNTTTTGTGGSGGGTGGSGGGETRPLLHAPDGNWGAAHLDWYVNYVSWDESSWCAAISGSTFTHAPDCDWSRAHVDNIINYKTWDGSDWTASISGNIFNHGPERATRDELGEHATRGTAFRS